MNQALKWLWPLLLWGVLGLPAHAEAQAWAYQCGTATALQTHWDERAAWAEQAQGRVPIAQRNVICWVRIAAPRHAAASAVPAPSVQMPHWLAFGDLHIQRVDVDLYTADMNMLGSAHRLGRMDRAQVSGQQALFLVEPGARFPLYARLRPVPGSLDFPGVDKHVRLKWVEWFDGKDEIRVEQQGDFVNAAATAFLVSTALLALLFYLAIGHPDYGIYALYAVVQAMTHFSKSGLPYLLDTQNPVWLNALLFQYTVSALSAWLYVRLGRFAQHSPLQARLGYGLMAAFFLLIPLQLVWPMLAEKIVFILLPAHFVVALSGNWRGWRRGEQACGILLVGLTPIALYWLLYLSYNMVLRQDMPVNMAVGSSLDLVRTLLLPVVFCLNLAYRTLQVQRDSLRMLRHDALTGLLNREGLRLQGERLLQLGCTPLVAVVNIKRFHAINEVLGPALGDRLLIEVGQRLRTVAQGLGAYHLARMHADQFCLLFESQVPPEALDPLLQNAFAGPADIAEQLVDLSIVAGTCRHTPGLTMADLMRNAEVALEASRLQHKTCLHYLSEMESSRRVDLSLLSQLRQAIDGNELRMFLQPKVNVRDGSLVGAEALVRWEHPVRGMIPPVEFVPFAEKTGRITDITHWMLGQAMRASVHWRRAGRPLKISVNLSTFDLADAGLPQRLERMLAETGALPADLCFEITESAAIQDGANAMNRMHQLCHMGFSFSIDDFGTGYSSLAYLQEMPVTELKVDRAFVRHVHHNRNAEALLDSIIVMGHRLGMTVVAEGAEAEGEWRILQGLDCDVAQGWFVARPMAQPDFADWVQANIPFQPKTAPL